MNSKKRRIYLSNLFALGLMIFTVLTNVNFPQAVISEREQKVNTDDYNHVSSPNSPNNLRSQEEFNWPDDRQSIRSVDYIVEFNPPYKDHKATMTTINLSFPISTNLIIAHYKYSDPQLLFNNTDEFNLWINNNTMMINDSDVDFIKYSMRYYKTELFCNLSAIGEDQIFRIDPMVTFSNYFRDELTTGYFELQTKFHYGGIENYTRNQQMNISTYKYSAQLKWDQSCG